MKQQQKSGKVHRHVRPRITLTATDHERLSKLVRAVAATSPEVAEFLTEELDRAHILAEGAPAKQTICMGTTAVFREEETGKIQSLTLVYPDQADIARGRISVLTPIGTALIGLSVGQSITWATRTGEVRRLTVLGVQIPQTTGATGLPRQDEEICHTLPSHPRQGGAQQGTALAGLSDEPVI